MSEKATTRENMPLMRYAYAAARIDPPEPPDDDFPRDPNRKYGFINTVGKDGKLVVQRYSYTSEPERLRKSNFLRIHPEFEVPPGDPIDAPKDARWGFVVTSERGQDSFSEQYCYLDDHDRQRIVTLMRGRDS